VEQATPAGPVKRIRWWVIRGVAVGLIATLVTLSGSLPSHPSGTDVAVTIVVRTIIYGAIFSVLWLGLDVAQRYWRRT
jgi:hypothetical protein